MEQNPLVVAFVAVYSKETGDMHNIVSKLLMYGDMPENSILMELSNIIREYKENEYKKDEIITKI